MNVVKQFNLQLLVFVYNLPHNLNNIGSDIVHIQEYGDIFVHI